MGNPTNFVIGKGLDISEYHIVRSNSEFMNHYAYSEMVFYATNSYITKL